jgi:two-component system sensor histidine kinase SenX3
MKSRLSTALFCLICCLGPSLAEAARIKDLADVRGVRPNQLIGYGVVIGLNGSGDSDKTRFTLQSVVSMLSRMGIRVDQRGLKLNFTEPPVPLLVTGDRRQLVSAIHALLENAVTYSPDGGTVTIGAVRGEGSDENGPYGLARITISDQGVGIPARDLERIFERFYRVDQGRSRQTGGTGLGLSIVRHVAQNHGGNVSVVSREGEGSTFILDLPLTSA